MCFRKKRKLRINYGYKKPEVLIQAWLQYSLRFMESFLCAWFWAKPFPCVSSAHLHSALSNKYYCFSQTQIRKQILEEVGNWPSVTHLMGWGLWLELWQTWLQSPVLTSWATLVLAAFSELVLQILENGRTYCFNTIFFLQ